MCFLVDLFFLINLFYIARSTNMQSALIFDVRRESINKVLIAGLLSKEICT